MQEASVTKANEPKNLAESLSLIALLADQIRSQEALLKQKDALIESQSKAIDESLSERNRLQTTIDEHNKTIERLMGTTSFCL